MSILACSTLQRPVFLCVSLTAGKWLFSLLFFSFVAPLYEVDSFLFNCLCRWELREHKMRAQMTRLFSCVNQRLRQRYFATAASFAVSLGKLILGKQVPKRKGSSIIFAQNWQLFFLTFPLSILLLSCGPRSRTRSCVLNSFLAVLWFRLNFLLELSPLRRGESLSTHTHVGVKRAWKKVTCAVWTGPQSFVIESCFKKRGKNERNFTHRLSSPPSVCIYTVCGQTTNVGAVFSPPCFHVLFRHFLLTRLGIVGPFVVLMTRAHTHSTSYLYSKQMYSYTLGIL
jgi:hypothetical protein